MDERSAHGVYLSNGILFAHEKEWDTDTGYSVHAPGKRYARWSKADTKHHSRWFHVYEGSRVGESRETERR